jgi:hypothetical protein
MGSGYSKVEFANGGVHVYLAGIAYRTARYITSRFRSWRASNNSPMFDLSRSMISLVIRVNPRRASIRSPPVLTRPLRQA